MFQNRHIGPTESDVTEMLDACGVDSIENLLKESLPAGILKEVPLNLNEEKSEPEVLKRLQELAEKNQIFTSLIGQGYYNSYMPSVIRRNILENPAWYSAYTPYQPEISQGRLELLLAFQTMICELTGMDLANASLLDEATAVAESMTLLARVFENETDHGETNKSEADKSEAGNLRFGVDAGMYRQTYEVLKGRAEPLGIELVEIDIDDTKNFKAICKDCFAIFLQLESSQGQLRNLAPLIETAHKQNALVSVAADPLALCLVTPPGQQDSDVVVGTTQRFGTPLGFGGPHAGYIAIRQKHQRTLPGRLVGVSKDTSGRNAYRLSLQTREQHIRKEKATSNICTAQVLLAIISALYAIYHGPKGLIQIAERSHLLATQLQNCLNELGVKVKHSEFFATLVLETPGKAGKICKAAAKEKINFHQIDDDTLSISFDETSSLPLLKQVLEIFTGALNLKNANISELLEKAAKNSIPSSLKRSSPPLTNPIFTKEYSEAEFTRYLSRLAKKDLALDHSMIPLGSCTMKLNSATELTPISWPAFADIHPLVPLKQAGGYLELLNDLSAALMEITGMDGASLQPNAGSQGELAGLLAIRKYHHSNKEAQKNICLIPTSAHGTNAASAVMAGMKVVILKCDADGSIDMADLKEKLATHQNQIATLMMTYPSTHGIFEENVEEICQMIHNAGGQIYMDGANLNALIGLARPGDFGVDVSHLNLHKTFCIPHGGGGPGVGPIVAKQHLIPWLPNHFYFDEHNLYPESSGAQISAAAWGSAGILPISWAYIQLMGASGLKAATQIAILSANYLVSQLQEHFPILYTGQNNRVAHECILDLRAFRNLVTVEDVAKRLMDYGFHAPTVSFPVADTLMLEPTESESKAELDRFVAAMANIRSEIHKIETGEWDAQDNPLKNAPHTAEDIAVTDWLHPYTRETAAYPLDYLRDSKYWPPVNRIDSVWGDRNLFCSCPDPADYE